MPPWATGIELGPYVLVAPLGAGGMGEVWKARDTRLERVVAIKRLHGHDCTRFEQEARAIAALNHPHICQIHDLGKDYLVLEYVEGTVLKGPLPVADALRLAMQIAGALDEAHCKGIIHRDLKPANIMVVAGGSVKLLDFGLATLLVRSADADVTRTIEGTVLGTAAYMSPEQAQGMAVDARSDIFSFGAVLYEMLAGRRAFKGDSTAVVLSAVLRDDPAPLQAPAALERVVMRCLAKKPAQRYQTMAEVKAALEQVSATPAEQQPSIAVLPFANMSVSKDDEYFSDGLAEEILNLLAHIPGLKVTARTSSFAIRGKEQDITTIAETLRVRTILEGSVRRAGNRIRVTAQLVNAADGYHLWSERFDRELTDVFAVQDEIATAIAGALQLTLSGTAGLVKRHKPNLPAYEAFLKGRYLFIKFTPDALARAKEYFEEAIALDPKYAEPHAELGTYYAFLASNCMRAARDVMPLARAEAERALELFPAESRAHVLLGIVAATYDYNWREAEKHFGRAMSAHPVPPEVRARHALFNLLPRGRLQEAVDEMVSVLEQDPLNAVFRCYLSICLNAAGMYDRSLIEAEKTLEIDEQFWLTYTVMTESYISKGMFADALESMQKAYHLAPWHPHVCGTLAGLFSRTGDELLAKEVRARLLPVGMINYHLLRLEIDAAADWYEKGIEQREPFAVLVAARSFNKPLRASPRWPALAKMMNLPESG